MRRYPRAGLFRRNDLMTDPFAVLRGEMDRLFEDFGSASSRAALSPRIDVSETDEAIEITAELPGVPEDAIDLTVEDNALILRGERREEREEQRRNWHIQERSTGTFARRIELPFQPDPGDISARFEHGVLTIVAPKPKAAKSAGARVPIQTGRGRTGFSTQPGPEVDPNGG